MDRLISQHRPASDIAEINIAIEALKQIARDRSAYRPTSYYRAKAQFALDQIAALRARTTTRQAASAPTLSTSLERGDAGAMCEISTLIAKLEAAAEGSHALDYEIYRAAHEYARNWLPDFPPGGLPQYTRSTDAALMLVPEMWTAIELRSRQARTRWVADLSKLSNPESLSSEDYETGHAATPALALVIAALRARQAAS
jgi:hypothetical protein